MPKINYLIVVFFLMYSASFGQQAADTALLLKEFVQVMSFTSKPHLFYNSVTTMRTEPATDQMDSMSLKGVFYKNNTEMYSSNTREEMYLQDSFMIEVNNERKTIWIRKVDISTKQNINLIPMNIDSMVDKFKRTYEVAKTRITKNISKLSFVEIVPKYSTSPTRTSVVLEYSENNKLPMIIEITVHMQYPVDEAILESMKNDGLDETKFVRTINGVRQFIGKQTMNIAFSNIGDDMKKLNEMPSYKSGIELDLITKEFVGKGQYKDYEITKMF